MKKILKVFLGVFVVLIVALISLYVFRNPIVDTVIEKLGTLAAGAKVEVDGVDTFLVEGRMNVTEAAFAVGYSSSGYFSKVFKKRYGDPPGKFVTKPGF